KHALGRIGATVEHDILDRFLEFCRNVLVDRQLAGVDDAHVHAIANGVVQEYGVNGFTHRLVAAERKRHVGHAAGNQGVGQIGLDVLDGFDEIDGVIVVLLDAGSDGKDVRVKDDIFRRKTVFHQQV